MPAPIAASDGHGSTITFSGLTGNIISIDGAQATREQIDTTHLGSLTKTSTPTALADFGETTIEIEYDYTALPPIQGAKGTLTIVWSTGRTWTYSNAYCINCKPSGAQSGQRITATVGFKLNGAPVIS